MILFSRNYSKSVAILVKRTEFTYKKSGGHPKKGINSSGELDRTRASNTNFWRRVLAKYAVRFLGDASASVEFVI